MQRLMFSNDAKRQAVSDELFQDGWIQSLAWFEQVDSSSNMAKRMLAKPYPAMELPALVIAEYQTSGRGRGGHNWWSPNGCLMLTLVLGPDRVRSLPQELGQLAMVCGVAVASSVGQFAGATQLKWPNDVYLKDKKVAGILIESAQRAVTENSAIDRACRTSNCWLIGIGLNIEIDWNQAPQEVRRNATCIAAYRRDNEMPGTVDKATVLVELVTQLRLQLDSWMENSLAWHSPWMEQCLLTGRLVTVALGPNKKLMGRCEGVDRLGRLMLRTETGMAEISAGQVIDWQ